jgi:hypothetical protein
MNYFKYFTFLVNEYNFNKLPEYQYVTEVHNDFIKRNIIIKIVFAGNYWIDIIDTKKPIADLLDFVKKTVDFDYSKFVRYNLDNLDPDKKIYNSMEFNNACEKNLWYYSKLLRENPQILNGDFWKLSLRYKIFRKLGFVS